MRPEHRDFGLSWEMRGSLSARLHDMDRRGRRSWSSDAVVLMEAADWEPLYVLSMSQRGLGGRKKRNTSNHWLILELWRNLTSQQQSNSPGFYSSIHTLSGVMWSANLLCVCLVSLCPPLLRSQVGLHNNERVSGGKLWLGFPKVKLALCEHPSAVVGEMLLISVRTHRPA